ncbi:MAG TPA: helix-turn-helix domain-containing protein [Sporichthyaceae bacterium]|nr:helix-turn-helix domain-containing protein [Sporichthyaceae bacterium]
MTQRDELIRNGAGPVGVRGSHSTATAQCRYIDLANGSLRRAAEVVGDKWVMMIVRDAMIGVTRFDELRTRLGCSAPVLSNRLRRLVRERILEPVPYQDPGQRTRLEYRLTDKGAALFHALAAIMQWGDSYLADPGGAAFSVRHSECGCLARTATHCERDGTPIEIGHLYIAPGPGARFTEATGARSTDGVPGPANSSIGD